MNDRPQQPASRGQIAIRLLFTILFIPIYGLCNAIVVLTTLFQFVLLFITQQHSEPVRTFANRVVTYAYRIWRYVSLNSNTKTFPFAEFPAEVEPPEAEVWFD